VAHVFISYAKQNRPRAKAIATLLGRQVVMAPDGGYEPLTVWWDRHLLAGEAFHREIARQIDDAISVVVVWSEDAVASDWVYAEAQRGGAQRKLVPLREPSLDPLRIPLPYGALHTDDPEDESKIVASVMARLGGQRGEDIRGLGTEKTWLLDPKAEPPLERTARVSPALLLQSKHRVVPFVDVDDRRSRLIDWALGRGESQPQRIAGRIIHGPGGLGKTRLLIEVVSELADQGWLAGFVERGTLSHPVRGPQLERLVRDGRDAVGLFIVADYAEGRADEVAALARLMIQRDRADGAPARLVLLSRGIGDWWLDLSKRDPDVALVFGTSEEITDTTQLPSIPAGDARLQIWRESAIALKRHLLAAGHSQIRDLDPAAPPPQLAVRLQALRDAPDYARPLAIEMEALLWLRGASPEAGERGIAPMLDRLLALERAHWAKVTQGVGEIERDRAMAQVTLLQGIEGREQAITLLQADSDYFGARTTAAAAIVIRELAKLCGDGSANGGVERFGTLEPDLLGEHHVASLKEAESLVLACLDWAGDEGGKRRSILSVLNRATRIEHGAEARHACDLLDRLIRDRLPSLAADMVAVMVETLGALAERLDRQINALDDEALSELDTALPLKSLSLMDLSLRVAQHLADLARASAADASDGDGRLAARLRNLGNRLSALSRREEALAAAQEAVDIYRRLAKTRPDTFLPDLAKSLNNFGAMLSNLGRREEALAATQEAVDIYRSLAKTRPDAFLPDLAKSLNNLGTDLSAIGRREEALAAAQEAVDIYRRLAQIRLSAFLPDLANSLNTLGAMLSNLGWREEALAAAQEAVDTYRRLAKTRPDAFLPDLANSLNNLGNGLSDLGRREEALAATQEALDIRRRLAKTRPDPFLPDLASSLNNLSHHLSELGRREEALATAQEAVGIHRRLAKTRPDAFLPDLANSLNNLGNGLSSLGRREEGLAAAQEAVDINRRLAKTRPDAFLPNLANSLNNLGNPLSDLGRREEALAAAQEAVDIHRRLAKTRPDAFLPNLASSLNNLGNSLLDLGRLEEALAAAHEAVDIHRRVAQARPDAFLPDLAKSLGALAQALATAERYVEAASIFHEGLRTIAPFIERHMQAFGQTARALARDYLAACERSGVEPEAALLAKVAGVLDGTEPDRQA
jgi:tetratricopeptide (TPR) repeat protein